MPALALLVIAAAIPWAIVDTIEKGRVCLFSWQFPYALSRALTTRLARGLARTQERILDADAGEAEPSHES